MWCACDETGVISAEVGLGDREREGEGEGVEVIGTKDELLRLEMCVYSSGSGSTTWKGRDRGNSCSGRSKDVNLKPEAALCGGSGTGVLCARSAEGSDGEVAGGDVGMRSAVVSMTGGGDEELGVPR